MFSAIRNGNVVFLTCKECAAMVENSQWMGECSTMHEWVKIKYDLGQGEIVNGYAQVIPHDPNGSQEPKVNFLPNGERGIFYHLVFFSDQGCDTWAGFNPLTRCFYGAI